MRPAFITLLSVLLSSSIALLSFSQAIAQSKTCDQNKLRKIEDAEGKVAVSGSTILKKTFDDLFITKNGDVWVSGHNLTFRDNEPKATNLLWSLSRSSSDARTMPIIADQIFWLDSQTGWIFGYGKGMFGTQDGGQTWQKVSASSEMQGTFHFLTANLGWYFDKNDTLKRWRDQKVNSMHLFVALPTIKTLQFFSEDVGWLHTFDRFDRRIQHQIFKSRDGGITWEQIPVEIPNVEDIQFVNENLGYAIGSDGIYRSSDGGRKWLMIRQNTADEDFEKLHFIDESTGWIVGRQTCFTTDIGTSWKCGTTTNGFDGAVFKKLVVRNLSEGWVLTSKGLYYSTDSGETWQRKFLYYGKEKF